MSPFDDEKAVFHVLTNSEGQHSLWPVFKAVPEGWEISLRSADRSECLKHIDSNWTDMRPVSLRRQMSNIGKPSA